MCVCEGGRSGVRMHVSEYMPVFFFWRRAKLSKNRG